MTHLHLLPAELLAIIVNYLEEHPPSYFGYSIEPTLGLISARHRTPPLKSLSRVCRNLRRATLPRLFRCTIHLVTIEARNQELEEEGQGFSGWPRKFWEFASFLEETKLGSVVRSFTLAVKEHPEVDVEYGRGYQPEEVTEYQSRWAYLLTEIAPLLSRITIIAPPALLSVLCGFQDDPLVYIMPAPYQILSMWTEPFMRRSHTVPKGNVSSEVWSLLTGRRWTHLLVNESAGHRLRRYAEEVESCHLITSSLLALQRRQNIFPEVRFVSYTARKPIRTHMNSVSLLLASLLKLEEMHVSLRSASASAVLDPHDLGLEEVWKGIAWRKARYAEKLGLESCLDHLKIVKSPDEVGLADDRGVLDPSIILSI